MKDLKRKEFWVLFFFFFLSLLVPFLLKIVSPFSDCLGPLEHLKIRHGLVRPGRQRWERRSEAGELARSQARCLIDRVGTFGPGAAAATKLRQWALQEEATMSKERNAHQLCLAQGRYALRRGQFHI